MMGLAVSTRNKLSRTTLLKIRSNSIDDHTPPLPPTVTTNIEQEHAYEIGSLYKRAIIDR